jgi:hypothetical protein
VHFLRQTADLLAWPTLLNSRLNMLDFTGALQSKAFNTATGALAPKMPFYRVGQALSSLPRLNNVRKYQFCAQSICNGNAV